MKTLQNKEKGVTLVELIISMGLGVIISAASLQVFLTFKQIYMTQQGLARIQENARTVNSLLGESVNSCGNLGCNAFGEDMSFHVSPDIDSQFFGLFPHQRVVGVTHHFLQNTLHLDKQFLQRISLESDILWVKSVKRNYPLVKATMAEEGFLLLAGQPKLKTGEVIALSDCSHVDFIKARGEIETKDHHISKLYFANQTMLSKHFQKGSNVGTLSSKLFYIGKTGRNNASGYPVSALYSTDLNGRTLELIEGAELLNVRYGVENENTISFVSREQVKDWQRVVKLRIKLLLNSVEDALAQPKSYAINDNIIMPKDKIMRIWWSFEWPIKGLIS